MENEQVKILAQNKDQLRNVLEKIKAKGVKLKNVKLYRASELNKVSLGSTNTMEEAGKKILFTSLTFAGLTTLVGLGLWIFSSTGFFSTDNFMYMIPLFGLLAGFVSIIFAGQIYAVSHEKDTELTKDQLERTKLVLGIEYDPGQKNLIRQVLGNGKRILL